ncbi:MAG: hypothetical protein PHY57_04765 [Ignavibacterium sp.]|jgi:hypothetical protein|nr:hypothetical protein [Ignavibacterium sp.]MDX9713272.1 hypothetical protein [Ignavibacteriaceae bacterium]
MTENFININEVELYSKTNIDPVGSLFVYQGKYYRAIKEAAVDDILYLFNSGAIDELNKLNLIPNTKISDLKLDGFKLVLEHEKIETITFSSEWSFEMLKAAAKLVIEVNKVLFKYGFETKDAHYNNIVFDKYVPKFVDIGSFHKRKSNKYWECKDEYYRSFVFPLKIWASGNSQLARRSISDPSSLLLRYEFTLYKHPIIRAIPKSVIVKVSFLLEVLRNLSKFDLDNILIVHNPKLKRKVLKILHKISHYGLLPHNNINLKSLERVIQRIKRPSYATKWGDYHFKVNKAELFKEGGRFNLIINLIKEYKINEVFEIGGNQGMLSIELNKFIGKVICSDYDEVAVDSLFINLENTKSQITPVLLDIMHPVYLNNPFIEKLRPQTRFTSQATLVLAVTHHLILGQKISIDEMFETILQYTKEYLFIEFMPNGIDKGPVPEWYNIDWFKTHFEKYLDTLLIKTSAEDGSRILFVGKVKN